MEPKIKKYIGIAILTFVAVVYMLFMLFVDGFMSVMIAGEAVLMGFGLWLGIWLIVTANDEEEGNVSKNDKIV